MRKSSPRETPPHSRPISQNGVGEERPPRRAKSRNQRFPRKALIAGRRRRLADKSGAYCRRVFNFWALRGAHGRYGRVGRKEKRRSSGMRPPGCGTAIRALRREVPKSCNPARPRRWSIALDGKVSVSLGAPVLVRAAPQREVRPHALRLDTLVRGRGKRIEKLLAIPLAHEPRIRQHKRARVA